MKKSISVFVLVFFFSACRLAFAGLSINEINYDLSGSDSINGKSREWVEIYNSGSNEVSVDASKWRFYDGGGNRTINGEVNFSIPANGYVIFTGDKDTFLAEHSSFAGSVYDTGFTSLNNTGTTLKILDQDGSVIDEVSYTTSLGGAGDGNSLQKISGSWVGSTPTPGEINGGTSTTSTSTTGGGNPISSVPLSSNTIPEQKKVSEIPKIKTKIISKTFGFVNLPLPFDATTLGYGGEQLHYGKYFWNFGDGDSKEIQMINSSKFTHAYFYPGEYVVSLSYYSNNYSDIPDAIDEINIKIVGADISISSVGDEKDFFVELSNNTLYNADISNWFLVSDGKSFMIPKNTILVSKKKMIISPRITNFSITDKDTLKLINREGGVVFDYTVRQDLAVVQPPKSPLSGGRSGSFSSLDKGRLGGVIDTNLSSIPEDLTSSAIQSNTPENSPSNSYLPIITSVIFIGASAGAVYFIRRKKVIPEDGNDFEILDE
ncbi:MAG: lamin tail domain-containing protein [Candidatus Paceibacterota bacterium]|jgi:hypothetical protein